MIDKNKYCSDMMKKKFKKKLINQIIKILKTVVN